MCRGERISINPSFLCVQKSSSREITHHLLDPSVNQASNLSSLGHPDLGPGADTGEHLHSDLPRLDGVVDVRSGDGKGEVDELEGERKEPVLVRDGGGLFGREVLAAEDAEGGLHVEVSHLEEVPVDGPTRPKGKGSGRR
jgi:hypothetical protein